MHQQKTHIERLIRKQLAVADRVLSHPEREGSQHDFRVALRRIRAYLRPYRDSLSGIKAVLRQIKKLMHASDEARNAEVWLAMLDELAEGARRQEYEGISQLRECLCDQYEKASARTNEFIRSEYPPVRDDLINRLSGKYRLDEGQIGRELHKTWQRLETSMRMPDRDIGLQSAHQIRLLTKRVRYLIECNSDSAVDALVNDAEASLKTLQDLLGNWRDEELMGDWLMETAEIFCGKQARKLVSAARQNDVNGFAALQAHEMLSGLIFIATRLSERAASSRMRLENWLSGTGCPGCKSSMNELIAIMKQ